MSAFVCFVQEIFIVLTYLEKVYVVEVGYNLRYTTKLFMLNYNYKYNILKKT